jgi:hypothetical protein
MEPSDAWRQPFGDSVWPINLSMLAACAAATSDGGHGRLPPAASAVLGLGAVASAPHAGVGARVERRT